MSRSQPSNNEPNPSTRWFEWNGEKGLIRYYDKEQKKNVECALPFTFLLLDEVASVGGWHEPSQSAIHSNQVRDTRAELFVVKSFKGGTLAQGKYQDIKDRVASMGGHYVACCYIAYKTDEGLKIGALQFKGAALGAWMEARKQMRGDIYKKALTIHDVTEGKKGRVVFKMPVFKSTTVSEETHDQAVALDQALQSWLEGYFQRKTTDRAEDVPVDDAPMVPIDDDVRMAPYADEVPF